jgi:UDP-N-acetylmuramate--alanine ligase
MHVYFSGIGGTGIGPLALIALQAGFEVSGSDMQESQYTHYLEEKGIHLSIGQSEDLIKEIHATHPIDWFVYSSALDQFKSTHPELRFVKENNIRSSKRDEFIAHLIEEKKLQMIAVSGTNGKTTTTAMLIWLCKNINLPISYSLGAKIAFGEMGAYTKDSTYFIYECDEYDRNFLYFFPHFSIITSIAWDHRDIYPTRSSYNEAFDQFINQSEKVLLYQKDAKLLGQSGDNKRIILEDSNELIDRITLHGLHNRQNAALAIEAAHRLTGHAYDELVQIINNFPGSNRRFERIIDNVYSDYAHTPEKIAATLQLAHEINKDVVVIYEPHNNDRQKTIINDYYSLFDSINKLYWLPTYIARKDADTVQLTPKDFLETLDKKTNAQEAAMNEVLAEEINKAIQGGNLVLCLSAGGGGSLDEWIRKTCHNGGIHG